MFYTHNKGDVCMGAIMMDRWSIESVLKYLGGHLGNIYDYDHDYYGEYNTHGYYYDNFDNPNDAMVEVWNNFLMASVLWDEIWSCHRELTYNLNDIFNNKSNNIINNLQNLFHQVDPSLIMPLYDIYTNLLYRVSPHSRTMLERTYGYQLISNYLSIPFLSHPKRNEFFNQGVNINFFTRYDLIDKIDKELIEYYDKINTELGRDLLRFNYPVLIDYIKKKQIHHKMN